MTVATTNVRDLITQLYDIHAVKFGDFKLKSGIQSPIYIDLRVIISYPQILHLVAKAMWEKAEALQFDVICGVPYTALPIATSISLERKIPMVMRRKEVKEYGTRKAIEGVFLRGQKCLILEDLVTSGSSVFETIAPLEHEGLDVHDVIVLLDRQQGAQKKITEKGYALHSVITITELLETLVETNRIDAKTAASVTEFIQNNQLS